MGYHLRDEVAAGPRAEMRETGRALTGLQGVGSGYRYYSSELGRWVNRDPIGERGGEHLCRLPANTAIDGIDALGLVEMNFGTAFYSFDRLIHTREYMERGGPLGGFTAHPEIEAIHDYEIESWQCSTAYPDCVSCKAASRHYIRVSLSDVPEDT